MARYNQSALGSHFFKYILSNVKDHFFKSSNGRNPLLRRRSAVRIEQGFFVQILRSHVPAQLFVTFGLLDLLKQPERIASREQFDQHQRASSAGPGAVSGRRRPSPDCARLADGATVAAAGHRRCVEWRAGWPDSESLRSRRGMGSPRPVPPPLSPKHPSRPGRSGLPPGTAGRDPGALESSESLSPGQACGPLAPGPSRHGPRPGTSESRDSVGRAAAWGAAGR